ncbi:hypothetical protein D3C73_1286490 [compost metagenome]
MLVLTALIPQNTISFEWTVSSGSMPKLPPIVYLYPSVPAAEQIVYISLLAPSRLKKRRSMPSVPITPIFP